MVHRVSAAVAVAVLVLIAPARGAAQATLDPSPGAVVVGADVDLGNAYLFRGVRQNATEMALWPAVHVAIGAPAGAGPIERVSVHLGARNSLHTGDTGSDGPSGRAWYESHLAAGVRVRLGGGVALGGGYSTYVSPNDMFTTVREVVLTVALDEPMPIGSALRPYGLLAFEVGAEPGRGQVDGGLHAGRYLELGVAPGYGAGRARIEFPARVGFSLSNYYEMGGADHAVGFGALGGRISVPLGRALLGGWSVRGGAEYHLLGTTPKAFNGGDATKLVVFAGAAWSR